MSFANGLHNIIKKVDPVSGKLDLAYEAFKPKTPPTPPGIPNPNDAQNQAQAQSDALRMRRGLLSNIYAGSLTGAGSQPVSGKQTLGT